jgi:hypothetical protein
MEVNANEANEVGYVEIVHGGQRQGTMRRTLKHQYLR